MGLAKLTQMEIEAIRHRYAQGEPARILAECFEVAERTVRRHVSDIPSPYWGRFDVKAAHRLRLEGYTLVQIAQRLGVARETVVRGLSRAGLSSAVPGRPRSFDHVAAAEMRRRGIRRAEVAACFGVNPATISKAMRRLEARAA